MKSLTLVFYSTDPAAARNIAASIRGGEMRASACDASVFTGAEPDAAAIVMPDVPAWRRKQIEAAYGLPSEITAPAPSVPAVTVKHRGFGKWFLMRGDEVVSGPHSKDEAQRLAA